MDDYSSFLFARPSFAEGLSRILDVGGTLNEWNRSPDDTAADSAALYADWEAIGQAIEDAAKQFADAMGVPDRYAISGAYTPCHSPS